MRWNVSNIANYLTSSAILVAYLGFAGGWGALFRRTTANVIFTILYGLFLMLPAALALPWHLPVNLFVWSLSLIVAFLYGTNSDLMPCWLWHRNFALGYFGLLMLLILGWTADTGQPILWVWIGLPASVTATLVWFRSFGVYFRRSRIG
jgi:hypothetical protein